MVIVLLALIFAGDASLGGGAGGLADAIGPRVRPGRLRSREPHSADQPVTLGEPSKSPRTPSRPNTATSR